MACCHNVLLLLDTAGGAAGRSPGRRAALRLLTHLSCRFGLARVRWTFKFFDSQGARGRPSRASDFRELGARSWEDFEAALEARLAAGAPGGHLPGPAPRAAHTRGALTEALLDYQWDRPELSSPAKPALRSRGRRLLDVEGEAREAAGALGGFAHGVFLLAPCPHSRRELLQFVAGSEAQAQRPPPAPAQVLEQLLPRKLQEVMGARRVTLYWVDTTERPQVGWQGPRAAAPDPQRDRCGSLQREGPVVASRRHTLRSAGPGTCRVHAGRGLSPRLDLASARPRANILEPPPFVLRRSGAWNAGLPFCAGLTLPIL